MLKSPFSFLLSCFRGIYLGKISALGRGNSNSIAAAAFLCKASFLVEGTQWILQKGAQSEMRRGHPWGRAQWVRHDWLVNALHWSHAGNPSRKGLVSPLGNCRWSFSLTSLFITMSTKFGHSLARLQNGGRQTQVCRDVFCPADQLCISSCLNHLDSLQLRKPKHIFKCNYLFETLECTRTPNTLILK